MDAQEVQNISEQVAAMLAAKTGQVTATAPAGATWGGPPGHAMTPKLLLLRVKIPVPSGEAGGYVGYELPPGATPQMIQAFAEQACGTLPVETFVPRENRGWGGGGYRNGYRGGYGGRRW